MMNEREIRAGDWVSYKDCARDADVFIVRTVENGVVNGCLNIDRIVETREQDQQLDALRARCEELEEDLEAYTSKGVTEDLLRKNDGFLKLGTGCTVIRSEEWDDMKHQLATATQTIERLKGALKYIAEYWNGHENERAMTDYCHMARDTAEHALAGEGKDE